MILNEIFSEYKKNYQDLAQDKSVNKIEDLRKTRLTLAQISQLRRMNDQRVAEFKENLEKVKAMYGAPAAPTM